LKQADPTRRIQVLERNAPGVTFGFGVVFSDPTLDGFRRLDPGLYAELLDNCVRWDPIEVRLPTGKVRCEGQGFSAIARTKLLHLLQERARSVGVELRFEVAFDDPAEFSDSDLLIVSEGARSGVRTRFSRHFQPSVETGASKYIWFGTTQSFDCLTFIFVENEHGAFAVHAYPFAPGRSTFIVETDEASWRNAKLDRADETQSLEYCEKLFAPDLGGGKLLVNQSRWANFRTLRTARWQHRNMVLIGDAAHTAHFSVGSGTKLALEDALALNAALATSPELVDACASYERERRAAVDRLQASAGPSLAWWENFRRYMTFSPEQFMFHFLTRNQRVTRESLRRRDPAFARKVDAWWAGHAGASIVDMARSPSSAPFRLRSVVLPGRRCVIAGRRAPEAGLEVFEWSDTLPSMSAAAPGEPRRAVLFPADESCDPTRLKELSRAFDLFVLDVGRGQGFPPNERIREARAAWPSELPVGIRLMLDERVRWPFGMLDRSCCDLVWIHSPTKASDGAAVLASDRMRSELGLATIVTLHEATREEMDTTVLSGRADLCLLVESSLLHEAE
jgi:anthraniloyl-CoA monooxygenase